MGTGQAQSISRLRTAARSTHLWLVLAMLVAISIVHYSEQLGLAGIHDSLSRLGMTGHTVDRILFLIPMIYAGVAFGLWGGLATCFLALAIMLPRAIAISPRIAEASLEVGGIVITGALASLWTESKVRRQETTRELESMQQVLQSHIRLSRSNEKRLATLNAISSMLSRSLELEHVLRSALEMVMEVMEVEVALIFSLDQDARELRLIAHEGVSDKFRQDVDRMKLGEGFNGHVALTGQSMVVENASHDARCTKEIVQRERIEAQLIVPLRARGAVIGTLCVANRRPRQFLSEEVELLTAIGSQIGITVENARFYREQQRLAKQYRDIFDNASDAIWVHDLEGTILAANKATARLTGYAGEDLLGMKATRFLSRQDMDIAREMRHKLLQGETVSEPYDQRLIKRDGTNAYLKLTSSLVMDDGRPLGFQHIARDVTEERRMQDNLRFYVQQVTRAQEEERKRIARELHDDTAQRLVALYHQLESFAGGNERLSAEDLKVIEGLRDQARAALQEVRHFSRDLRPSVLDDLGLLSALEWLTDDLERQSGIKAELKVYGSRRRFSPEVEVSLFRIVQEALNNARRHAGASRVEITVVFAEGETRASIRDNGKGFEVPTALGELSRSGKLGLIGMQERARLLGGGLTVQSAVGQGTTVIVEVPV